LVSREWAAAQPSPAVSSFTSSLPVNMEAQNVHYVHTAFDGFLAKLENYALCVLKKFIVFKLLVEWTLNILLFICICGICHFKFGVRNRTPIFVLSLYTQAIRSFFEFQLHD
jgi:hypothetical protein